MIVRGVETSDLIAIVAELRAESAAEAYASLPQDDPAMLAETLAFMLKRAEFQRVICDDAGRPMLLIAVMPRGPGRGGMVFLARAGADVLALHVTRWWRSTFMPEVMRRYRRVEFTGSRPDTASGRWLRSVGFHCEGIAYAYGKHGEDFGHWAWIHPAAVDARRAAVVSGSRYPERKGAASHV